MATKKVIKWNIKAFTELRTLPAMGSALGNSAQAIQAGCGPGYTAVGPEPGGDRLRAAVFTETAEAMVDNATNNTLLSNIDRGRV